MKQKKEEEPCDGEKRTFVQKVQWLIDFMLRGVFRVTETELSRTMRFFIRLLKKLILSIRGFIDDNLSVKASALTYYTALAIVPIFALFVAIGRGFGFQEYIENFVVKLLGQYQDMVPTVMGFINNYLDTAQGGMFLGVGLIVLLWAVVSVFRQIEANFNRIWNVKKNRSIVRQFTTYLTIMIVVPLLIVLSSGLNVKLDEYVELVAHSSAGVVLIPVYQFLLKLAPFVIYWMLFMLVFMVIPNTKVRFSDAMLSGVVTGTIFLLIQFLYVNGQISLSRYNAVYGSFAAIPLLLFWLHLSWLIVLYGAELCYVSQNLENFSFEHDTRHISRRYKDYTMIIILRIVIDRFCASQPPLSANEISTQYNIPIRLVLDQLKVLVDIGILSELYVEAHAERLYQPALDVNLITLQLVLDRINRFGSENFKIIGSKNFDKIWQNLQQLQQVAYDEAGNILIKDM